MPGPALHHMIVDALRKDIQKNKGLKNSPDYKKLQELLNHKENLPYLFLGCQGPDFLFFNTKDWPAGPVGYGVEKFYEVYDAIDQFKETVKALVPQAFLEVIEAAGVAADTVIESSATLSELKELLTDAKGVTDALLANLEEMVKKYITDFDLYGIFKHPFREGQEKGEWWWFDALHYRKTGRYAQALLDAAPQDSPLHLYALGYLTHFTADTVGHPFVNVNSGGPYRHHAQRHKTAENYQDVYNMLNHTGKDWNRSKLHAFYNFNYNGTVSAAGETGSDEVPDPNTHLPQELADFIAETITKVYTTGSADDDEYGRTITAEDVNNSYRLWYRWMRSATDTGTLPAPVPYSLTAELTEVYEKALENLGNAGDFLENATDHDGSFSFLDFLRTLAALLVAAVLAAAALIDALLGMITTLTVAGIRYVLSMIYEQLYNAFGHFRLAVSMNGLAFPMQEHLDEPRFTQFKNTSFKDTNMVTASMLAGQLPKYAPQLEGANWFNHIYDKEKQLAYPPLATPTETDRVIAAPNPYFAETPLYYAFGGMVPDTKFIDALAGLGGEEEKIRDLFKKFNEKGRAPSLGDAMHLTEEIYARWKERRQVPDFNLDADRGYAYTCWTQRNVAGTPDPLEAPNEMLQHQQQETEQPLTSVSINFIPNH